MFAPGDVLSERFRLEGQPIGAGNSCEVWPAVEVATGRRVVVKVLHAHLADPALIGAAANRAAVGPNGGGSVEVLGVFGGEGRWWLVVERVEGVTLDTAPRMSASEALELALGVARQVATLHRGGRVHGSVRPGRVWLSADGPRLGEPGFGFGVRPGTSAPEVLAGALPGRPADVYGLGLVLYRALSGRAPWAGATPFAVSAAQRAGPPRVPPGPVGLGLLAVRLLAPDPRLRPGDAGRVVAALRQLRADPTRPVRFATPWMPPIRPSGSWLVHGIDPATGAPAAFASRLSGRKAQKLVSRLRAEGWTAVATREAWGGTDLVWLVLGFAVGGALLSAPGAIAGLLGAWSWRLSTTRPELSAALPPVTVPLPPLVAQPGAEEAVLAGLLLLAAAATLPFVPWIAAALVLAVVGFAVWSRHRPIRSVEGDLARGRLEVLLVDSRRLLETRALSLDDALAVEGELWAIEGAWRRGEVTVEAAIVRAEQVHRRAGRRDPMP